MTHDHQHAATIARLLLAGVLTTLASATEAQGFSETWMNVPSLKSRVDLQVEVVQARSDGSMAVWKDGYVEPMTSTRSRAQVLADVTEGRAKGEVY